MALDEEGRMEQARLNKRPDAEVEEGDLFGIRAIERGFYGGVAQSPGPTPSVAPASSITLGRIPYGKGASWGIAADPPTIAPDLGAGPGRSPPNSTPAGKPPPAASVAAGVGPRAPESPAQPTVLGLLMRGAAPGGSSMSDGGRGGCQSDRWQPPGPVVAVMKPPRVARPTSPGFPLRKHLDPPPRPPATIAPAPCGPAHPGIGVPACNST